jgi:hypothetical protein
MAGTMPESPPVLRGGAECATRGWMFGKADRIEAWMLVVVDAIRIHASAISLQ